MLGVLHEIDELILLGIHQGWRSPWGDRFFIWLTEPDHFIIPLGVVWLLMLVFGGRRGRILGLMIAIGVLLTDQVSSQLIKPLVDRARPCFVVEGVSELLPQANSPSFPSSHATNMFGAATLFWLAGKPRAPWALAFVVAALVAVSRVYVGVHYPSDVVAGALLGILIGGLVFSLVTRFLPLEGGRGRRPRGGGRPRLVWLPFLLGTPFIAGCGSEREPAPPVAESVAQDPAPPWITVIDTVRRGDTFSDLLLRNQLYLRDIEQVIREIRTEELFSLRRLKPGETVRVSLDLDGALQELRYQKSPDEIYVVEVEGEDLNSYRTGLVYESRLRKLSGTLETTVDEMLQSGGAGPGVTLALAKIFDSDIDFLTEPRVGDHLVILMEEKRYEGEKVADGEIYYAAYEGKRVSQTAIRFLVDEQAAEAGRYYTPGGESLVRAFLRSPLNYRRVSSKFSRSRFHPILRVYRPHLGVDYAAATGTPVVALGDGTVTFRGWKGGFGNYIRLRHGSIYESSYGHLGRYADGIKKGARVSKGQVIGYVGSTGLATGPHLDFRVQRYGAYIDPLKMDNPTTAPVPVLHRERFDALAGRLKAVADSLGAGGTVSLQQVRRDARALAEHAASASAASGS